MTEKNAERVKKECDTPLNDAAPDLSDEINVIQIPDDDLELPSSTSGLIRGFQFNDDSNYDILMDIDEFSDFQLLSPDKEYDGQDEAHENEQFSIIDATGKQHVNFLFLVFHLIEKSFLLF